jgi:hypothetical protein
MAKSSASIVGSRARPTSSDDRILPITRAAGLFVIIILAFAVLALYFFPDRTSENFAWTIKPSLSALAIGAGYIMGIYFFVRVVSGTRWHHVAIGFLPITAFTIFMLVSTFVHWDRFNQGSLPFLLWTAIYILTPVLVPFLWFNNRGTDPGTPEADDVPVPNILRTLVGIMGVVIILLALAVFSFPDLAIRFFPWKLTPLMARVFAGWAMLPGVGGIMLSRETRWSGLRVIFEAAIVGILFFLLALPRAWSDLDSSSPVTWGFLALIIAAVLGMILFYLYMQMRRARVRLAEQTGM